MSKLYLIPTPIGNLEDITFRATRILEESELILAEDTRKTGFLLKHLKISKPIQSYHKFNEHKALKSIIEKIESGIQIAVVSDAGTPGISDPGFLLVRECLRKGVDVECLPGATAFVPALVNSGLPSDRFVFEGFLPQKKGRQKRLESISTETRTMIFYESPYRLIKTLENLGDIFGKDRQASVSRELTKIHEENIRGSLSELIHHFGDRKIKGEIVIVLAGKE
ncbi:16S rRNA (cytidine(1402)-2'-O)-methyltransferase [Bacteroidota bacterium]